MNNLFHFFFSFFLLTLPLQVTARHEKSLSSKPNPLFFKHNQMILDLDFMTNIFQISYGPAAWKNERFGWDLSTEILKSKKLIADDPSLSQKEFQRIVKEFCFRTKDYHVIPQFYSTEGSSLPFQIQGIQGKYFVSEVFPEEDHSLTEFPLSVGDELLAINGKPVSEVLEKFRKKEIGENHLETDKALAELYFTSRLGSSGHEIPKGSIEIRFCKKNENRAQKCTLEWNYHSQKISQAPMPYPDRSLGKPSAILKKNPYKKQFTTPHCALLKKKFVENNEPSDMLGSRKSRIPPLGMVLWESDPQSEFHAYLFLMDDMHVGGYVRIPSYNVDGDYAADEFAELIEVFQEVSDVLVIDQVNNGGGLVLYLYALVAMLTDYELKVPMHQVMLTQEEVYFAYNSSRILESVTNNRSARKILGDTLEGITVDYNLVTSLLNSHQFVINQWNSGKLFTDFHHLYGIEKISPHPEVNYKKPILILTNSLDFSAADFFPAIMQDNGRAKIMGSRTAGAGGYVEKIFFPNLNGVEELDVTASFAVRSNGMPIENYGVTPDIPYEITEVDIKNNYCDYKENILIELKKMCNSSDTPPSSGL